MAVSRRRTSSRSSRSSSIVAAAAAAFFPAFANLCSAEPLRILQRRSLILTGMRRLVATAAGVWVCVLGLAAQSRPPRPASATPPAAAPASPIADAAEADTATQTVRQYCIGCHSDRGKAGDLSL